MSSFAKEMSFYTAYHQEHTNVWIHVFGVPLITFTAFIPLAWLELFQLGGVPITAATALYLYSVQYYLRTDLLFGGIATVLYGALLYAAHLAAAQGYAVGWALFAAGQIVGWTSQIYGHLHYEGNKPAFFESIYQSFISAPLFIIADLCFHFGLRRELQQEIHQELIDSSRLREKSGNFFQPHQA
ncbi:MAG: DUF962 domain-containing protein [Oceanococcus sp.]